MFKTPLNVLLLLLLLLGTPYFAFAEVKKDVQPPEKKHTSSVAIGDPKEIFVKKLPKKKHTSKKEEKRKNPESFGDFFSLLKKDLAKAGDELELAVEDISQKNRKTIEDPDFVQPERPDWR